MIVYSVSKGRGGDSSPEPWMFWAKVIFLEEGRGDSWAGTRLGSRGSGWWHRLGVDGGWWTQACSALKASFSYLQTSQFL